MPFKSRIRSLREEEGSSICVEGCCESSRYSAEGSVGIGGGEGDGSRRRGDHRRASGA